MIPINKIATVTPTKNMSSIVSSGFTKQHKACPGIRRANAEFFDRRWPLSFQIDKRQCKSKGGEESKYRTDGFDRSVRGYKHLRDPLRDPANVQSDDGSSSLAIEAVRNGSPIRD